MEVCYFTRGANCQKGAPKSHQGPEGSAPRGHSTRPRGTHHLGPQRESSGWPVPISSLSTENQPQIFFPNFPELSSCYPWISKFRADFSNLFGGVSSLVCDSSTHPISFCSCALFMEYFSALVVTKYD